MRSSLFAVVGAGVLSALVGCGSSGSESTGTVRLQATVARADRTLDNARAVAIASDGHRYWAFLDAWGNFTLNVPAGKSYRILVVNTGTARVAGHLVILTSAGSSRWISLDSAGTVDLGELKLTATTAGGVTTQSAGESSDGAGENEHDDDPATHAESEDDDGEHDDACSDHDGQDAQGDASDDDDVELHPSKEPGDRLKDRHESEHEDGEGHDREDRDDKVCSSPASPPAASPGSGGVGAACATNAECGAGLACVASKCTAPLR